MISEKRYRFGIEELDKTDGEVFRVFARCDQPETAQAALKWARDQYPLARLVIRDQHELVSDTLQ